MKREKPTGREDFAIADWRILNRTHFRIGMGMLAVVMVCYGALIATRSHVEEFSALRDVAFILCFIAAVLYLVVMFRPAAYHLSRNPQEVMDSGSHPSVWMRLFLILTAQILLPWLVFMLLPVFAAGLGQEDLAMTLGIAASTAMLISMPIALMIVAVRRVRGEPFPVRKPTNYFSVSQRKPTVPVSPRARLKSDPDQMVSAKEWQMMKLDRASELERELEAASTASQAPETLEAIDEKPDPIPRERKAQGSQRRTLGGVSVSAQAPETPEAPEARPNPIPVETEAQRSQRRALEAELVSILSQYQARRRLQLEAYRERRRALAIQTQADAARLKAAEALQEKYGEAAQKGRPDAEIQAWDIIERQILLNREVGRAQEYRTRISDARARLDALLDEAASRMEPRGAALATPKGQRMLLADVEVLLPSVGESRAAAMLREGISSEDWSLPDAVGELLTAICDALEREDPRRAEARWQMLTPEALVRGWRALRLYRDISAAQALFDAVLARTRACVSERDDCVAWLLECVEAEEGNGHG